MSDKKSKIPPHSKQPTPKILPLVGPSEWTTSLFWNDANLQLYFVNVIKNEIHRFDPKSDEHRIAKVGDFEDETVAFVIPIAEVADKFIIGLNADLMEITWDGVAEKIVDKKLIKKIDETPGVRISCAIVTPKGGLYIGTQSPIDSSGNFEPQKAALFHYGQTNCAPLISKLTYLSGMYFSGCGKKFYLVDSEASCVEGCDHKLETDELANRQTVFDFKKRKIEGKPYGVVCDTDTTLWITTYGGKMILRVDPKTGAELLRVKFDAVHITSLCFAGSFFCEMYATTGRLGVDNATLTDYPSSGYLFRVTNLGTARGFPCRAFCLKTKT